MFQKRSLIIAIAFTLLVFATLPGQVDKFLLDEDIPPKAAEIARGLGLDARSVIDLGRTGWSDAQFARRMRDLQVSVRMDFFRRALVKPRLYGTLFRELKMVLSGRLRRYGGRLSSLFRKNAAVMVK